MFVKRELAMDQIRPFIGRNIIKIITGIRRSGKSVMLQLIQEELAQQGVDTSRMLSFNFDTFEAGTWSNAEDLYGEIKKLSRSKSMKGKPCLFFDEIQELDGWEKLANSCLTELGADIYITGSNSKMLSDEYATYLSGRYVMFRLYPFSFSEARAAFSQGGLKLSEQESFEKYLVYGGMPFVYQLIHNEPEDSLSVFQYLRDIGEAIILKDICGRYRIRDIDQLKRLIMYLFSNIGNPFSAGSIQKYLKNEGRSLSWEMVNNYIEYCKNACLLLPALREDLSGKEILRVNEKIFITDHGLREAMYGNNKRDVQMILENIVYLELLRRNFRVTVGKVTVGKTVDGEIDFIAQRNEERLYIQVAYLLASKETIDREFSPLLAIKDNYPKYVLSMDEIDMSRKGIKHINLRKFLLQKVI
jgi:predicted AAA+ superfamily ATPase